jgi:hypothetical protein
MSADARKPSKLPADQFYFIDQATYFASKADSASVRKWEWAAFGSLLLFVYFAFVSPPWQAIKIIDLFVIALVFAASWVLYEFERRLEEESAALSELSMKQFELAAKNASVTQANEEPDGSAAAPKGIGS